jgi:hypothetical protein
VSPNGSDATLLPEGARLLHIGIPKTGTTAIQGAAAASRQQLLEHGVCYPGRGLNHLEPICALMGRSFGSTRHGPRVPPRARWSELMAEVGRTSATRTLISHEFAAESTDEQARRFLAELGDQTYVVITLRSFAALLGSSWQQYVKAGHRKAYETWLREVLADKPSSGAARLFHRRNDQPAIVRRWREAAGRDRVIVVVPDKTDPNRLLDAFSGLLGLPPELLRDAAERLDASENRSLSWPEVEYLRRLNVEVRRQLEWRHYELWVRNGAVARLLASRRPESDEPRVTLPCWAAEPAAAISARYAEAVAASGCLVLGDVDALAAPGPVGDLRPARLLPIDAAVAATAGLISASLGQGADFDVEARPLRPVARKLLQVPRARRWLELNEAVPTAAAGDLLAVSLFRAARQLRARFAAGFSRPTRRRATARRSGARPS